MTQFYLDRMDYIFFFYGLGFLVMAQVCLSMRRASGEPKWVWLALFGVLHGFNEWLDLAANSLGDSFLFSVIRNAILLLSFIFLLEFARRSQVELKGAAPGAWLHLLLLAGVALGLLDGLKGINAVSRYTFGLAGGLWSAYILAIASRSAERPGSRWLVPASLAIGVYAVLTGAVVPEGAFYPTTILNYGTFVDTVGVPVQLLRGLMAIMAAVSILFYSHPSYRTERFAARYSSPLSTFIPVIIIHMMLVGGWYFTEYMGVQDVEEVSGTIETGTLLASSIIQPDEVRALMLPGESGSEPLRTRVEKLMSNTLESVPGGRSVCLMSPGRDHEPLASVIAKGKWSGGADCEYHEIVDMSSRSPQVVGPITYGGDSWVVSAAPVKDGRGKVVAQLVIGLDGGLLRRLMLLDRFFAILVTGTLCVLTILVMTFWQRTRESSAQRFELGLARQKLADEKRLREITSALGEGVIVIDLDGRMTFMNPEAERLLGWTEHELMGRDIHTMIRHRHVDGTPAGRENCPSCHVVRTGESYQSDEEEFTRKDGTVFQVSYVAAPIIVENRIAGAVTAFQDITNRKTGERELKLSEQSYRTLSENLPGIVYRVHLGGGNRMQFFNDMVEPMTGYTVEELGSGGICSIEPYIFKEDISDVLNAISISMMEEKPFQVEYRFMRKDGATRHFMERGRPVRGAEGEYRYIDGVIIDITDSKRIEERFSRLNECLLSFGPDPSQNMNSLTELCGELMGADIAVYNRLEDDSLVRVGGWKVPPGMPGSLPARGRVCYDVIKRGRDELVYIEDLQSSAFAKSDPNVAEQGFVSYMGHPVKVGDSIIGMLCMLFRSVYKPNESDEKLVSLLSSAIGVEEERRIADEELRKFMSIVEGAGEEIYLFGDTGRLLYANGAACEALGYERPAMAGLHARDIMPEMRGSGFEDHLLELRKRDMPAYETELVTRSGEYAPKEVKSAYMEIGQDGYVCSFSRDISERRDLERRKEDFFGMVTHDLKSPLSIILGYTDLMLSEFSQEMPADAVDMAQSISTNSRRLLEMVEDFLAMKSLESRGIEFTMGMESPVELARSAGEDIEPVSLKTGTAFTLDIPEKVQPTAMNRQHVYRAVMNLLYNAFAYTPEGGSVGLRVGTETRKAEEYVYFAVTDNGPGIPVDEVPRIFERYYRSPKAKDMPGTGMGLAIVKAVAEAHGGHAEVDTEPGRGSTFRLLIPVRKI